MESFTKVEIEWMATAILHRASELKDMAEHCETAVERSLLVLRAEQLSVSASKLLDTVHKSNRRIEIKY